MPPSPDDRNRAPSWRDRNQYSDGRDGRYPAPPGQPPAPSHPVNPYVGTSYAYTPASGSGIGSGSGSGRRSRSPDGGRNRQSSNGSGSMGRYRSDHYVPGDVEPGQIVPSRDPRDSAPRETRDPRDRDRDRGRDWERDQYSRSHDLHARPIHGMPPASGSNYSRLEYRPRKASASERARSRDNSPAQSASSMGGRETLSGKDGSVAGALESFSKTMHSTLVSTSTHALALAHFTRLTKFPYTNPTSPSFEEAHRRVQTAEKALNDQMVAMQSSFTELMRRAVGRIGDGGIGALEIDGLKERLRKLEQVSSKSVVTDSPAPPNEAPPPPLPADAGPGPSGGGSAAESPAVGAAVAAVAAATPADNTARAAGTRGRLKAMLLDIMGRLEAVETLKESFEDRLDDVETALMVQEADELDEEMLYSWNSLEDERDPDGRLRGLKRKDRDFDKGQTNLGVIEIDMESEADAGQEPVLKGKGKESVESVQRQLTRMANELSDLRAQAASSSTSTSAVGQGAQPGPGYVPSSEIKAIQGRLAELGEQITTLQSQVRPAPPSLPILTRAPSATPTESSSGDYLSNLLAKQMSALQAERHAIVAADAQPPGQPQVDTSKFESELKALKDEATRLDGIIQELLADKEARSTVYAQISTGIGRLADNIKRCRLDLDEHKAGSQASSTAQLHQFNTLKAEAESLKSEVRLLKEEKEKRLELDKATKLVMQAMKTELDALREGYKEIREGRDAFEKRVMESTLEAVKEEAKMGEEDYAKITKREIQNFVKGYMSKRNSLVAGDRSTSEPSNSPGVSPSVKPGAIGSSNATPPLPSGPASSGVTSISGAGAGAGAENVVPLPTSYDTSQQYTDPNANSNPQSLAARMTHSQVATTQNQSRPTLSERISSSGSGLGSGTGSPNGGLRGRISSNPLLARGGETNPAAVAWQPPSDEEMMMNGGR